MNIVLEPGASALLDALHRAGFAAYAVGGCVRDSLLGLAPHDWDLCTAARPEQVMELFGEKQCIPTGLQHGTVTVKRNGRLYEITTFRTEGSYSDGRHPDSVAFVPDVREDLARRDFTINAMAYSAEEGLCDPFGGQEDLARGVVRAVGEPLRRFEEDALRILRLYRFAARFGFVIDEATEAAAKQLAAHLDCVSVERIEEELNKLLSAPKPGAYLEPEVLAFVLPELPSDDLSEAREIIDALPAGAEEVTTRWAALLLPLGEDGIRKALKRLKCSNAVIDGVSTLVKEKAPRTMAYSAEEGLCDPFGGQEDLARGVVRAVGEPLRRFEEDALRILRLYRFAARFGFVIDEATEAAAKQLAAHLDCVSVERIEEELNKLLSAPKPGAYLEPEVLAFVLPELPSDDLSEAREIIDALPAGAEEVTTRWAALLLPLGEDGIRKALKRLKCSNAVIDGVSTLVKEKAPRTPALSLQAKRLLGKYDLHTVQQLTALWSALQPERKDEFTALQKEAGTLTAQSACCRVSQLAVNGRDLMAAGVAPGPGLRRALEALLEEVITGRLPNEKAELLAFAAKFSAA